MRVRVREKYVGRGDRSRERQRSSFKCAIAVAGRSVDYPLLYPLFDIIEGCCCCPIEIDTLLKTSFT